MDFFLVEMRGILEQIRCFSRTRSTPSSLTRLSPGNESLTSSISRLQNAWNQGG